MGWHRLAARRGVSCSAHSSKWPKHRKSPKRNAPSEASDGSIGEMIWLWTLNGLQTIRFETSNANKIGGALTTQSHHA
jgi:hypothetical protein